MLLCANWGGAALGQDDSCCVVHRTSGCANDLCEFLICCLDPFCCTVEWDSICVAEAERLCVNPCATVTTNVRTYRPDPTCCLPPNAPLSADCWGTGTWSDDSSQTAKGAWCEAALPNSNCEVIFDADCVQGEPLSVGLALERPVEVSSITVGDAVVTTNQSAAADLEWHVSPGSRPCVVQVGDLVLRPGSTLRLKSGVSIVADRVVFQVGYSPVGASLVIGSITVEPGAHFSLSSTTVRFELNTAAASWLEGDTPTGGPQGEFADQYIIHWSGGGDSPEVLGRHMAMEVVDSNGQLLDLGAEFQRTLGLSYKFDSATSLGGTLYVSPLKVPKLAAGGSDFDNLKPLSLGPNSQCSKLGLVVHGTNATCVGWPLNLAGLMAVQGDADWQMGVIDWREHAGSASDILAGAGSISRRGYEAGRAYAEYLARAHGRNLEALAVWGHSAGAIFCDGLVDRYREIAGPDCRITLCMLDANDVADAWYWTNDVDEVPRPCLGNRADFGVHVVDLRDLLFCLPSQFDATDHFLPNVLNIDVTPAAAGLSPGDGGYCAPTLDCILKLDCFHAWPYAWYSSFMADGGGMSMVWGFGLTDVAPGPNHNYGELGGIVAPGHVIRVSGSVAEPYWPTPVLFGPGLSCDGGSCTITAERLSLTTVSADAAAPPAMATVSFETSGTAVAFAFDGEYLGGPMDVTVMIDSHVIAQYERNQLGVDEIAAENFALSPAIGPGSHVLGVEISSRDGGVVTMSVTGAMVGITTNLADINQDGLVNALDLAVLLGNWGGAGLGDVDLDGVVDAADLATLLGLWSSG